MTDLSPSPLSNNRGFSLIEVLVAMVVLSIGIFAVGKIQGSAIKGDFQADKLTRSSSMAANEAERLLRLDINDDELAPGEHNPDSTCTQFCIGWTVTDDVPLQAVTHDTNGVLLASAKTQTKSIEIVVFSNGQGFAGEQNKRLKINIVKSRNL